MKFERLLGFYETDLFNPVDLFTEKYVMPIFIYCFKKQEMP